MMEKEYKSAPEEVKSEQTTTQLVKENSGSSVRVLADLGKDDMALFDVANFGSHSSFTFLNSGKNHYSPIVPLKPLDGNPIGMKTTREEAENIVKQCLLNLEIEDMQINSIQAANYYKSEDAQRNYKISQDVSNIEKQCYVFRLAKTIRGVPVTDVEASVPMDTDDPNVPASKQPEYKDVMRREELEILIDDTGIVEFSWREPDKDEFVLSGHVDLMKFDEIIKKAKDNMFFKNYTAYGSKTNIKISSIKLGMMRIMRKDKPGEYLIVPVWDFIGTHTHIFEGKEEPLPFGDQSYATINAIDGSFINRDWGY